MQSKLINHLKTDTAVAPASVASAAVTGEFFNLKDFKRALFVFAAAAMAKGATVVAQIMKATDGLGSGATELTGAVATITSPTNVKKALITANTIADGDSTFKLTVKDADGNTVREQTYLCEDTTPDASAGEFASGADDDAAIDNLKAVVNSLQGDYLTASSSGDPLTIEVDEPGKYTLSISDDDATITPSALEAEGYVEIADEDLGDGYTHAALRLTTDATIVVGGTLIRGGARYSPKAAVAASKEL